MYVRLYWICDFLYFPGGLTSTTKETNLKKKKKYNPTERKILYYYIKKSLYIFNTMAIL